MGWHDPNTPDPEAVLAEARVRATRLAGEDRLSGLCSMCHVPVPDCACEYGRLLELLVSR